MFYITSLPEEPEGYVNISTSSEWERWVRRSLPEGLDVEVQRRLISNLKHVLVGLELKAALIVPHARRGSGPSVLFEPYLHIMSFEFCVGAFSVFEGIGSALWLRGNGFDGSAANRIGFEEWKPPLISTFDPDGQFSLEAGVDRVKSVRDKLHQDRLGARENIDWHAFSFDEAFVPAFTALQCLLLQRERHLPEGTNLRAF
ncbi:hypothetical protein [Rhizobium ruizarguesonis]|uniref:hypothetical protein n=1 Tax=Rhizobium ruizarguesonis TaxID=2081791 RepID=UPI0010323107|nr:hypothetical protein [Rhizobium ruizarguesonis]TAU02195.1 hypothetical protein ELI53_22955 [Rhizobium ruizarguesonis]